MGWVYMCYKVQRPAIMYYKSQTACCDQNELTSSLTRCCFSFFSNTILSFFSGFGFFTLYFIQRSESLSVQEKKKNDAQYCKVQERKKFKWWRFSHRYNTIWKELLSNNLHFTVKVQSKLDHGLNSSNFLQYDTRLWYRGKENFHSTFTARTWWVTHLSTPCSKTAWFLLPPAW